MKWFFFSVHLGAGSKSCITIFSSNNEQAIFMLTSHHFVNTTCSRPAIPSRNKVMTHESWVTIYSTEKILNLPRNFQFIKNLGWRLPFQMEATPTSYMRGLSCEVWRYKFEKALPWAFHTLAQPYLFSHRWCSSPC